MTFTFVPPRNFFRKAARAFLESLSVIFFATPAASVGLAERNLTRPHVASILALPDTLAVRRNVRSPVAETFALDARKVGLAGLIE